MLDNGKAAEGLCERIENNKEPSGELKIIIIINRISAVSNGPTVLVFIIFKLDSWIVSSH